MCLLIFYFIFISLFSSKRHNRCGMKQTLGNMTGDSNSKVLIWGWPFDLEGVCVLRPTPNTAMSCTHILLISIFPPLFLTGFT